MSCNGKNLYQFEIFLPFCKILCVNVLVKTNCFTGLHGEKIKGSKMYEYYNVFFICSTQEEKLILNNNKFLNKLVKLVYLKLLKLTSALREHNFF